MTKKKIGCCKDCSKWGYVEKGNSPFEDLPTMWFGDWVFYKSGVCSHCESPNNPTGIVDEPSLKDLQEIYDISIESF